MVRLLWVAVRGNLEGVVLVLAGGRLVPGMIVDESSELLFCVADFDFLSWVSGISFVWLPMSAIILVVKSSRLWIWPLRKLFLSELLPVSEAECSSFFNES